MSAINVTHRCDEQECCYTGQPSPAGCGCHKSDRVMLEEAAEALLAVVIDMFENPTFQVSIGGNPNMVDALMERAHAAIAKAEGRP